MQAYNVQTSNIPHCIGSQITNGDEVVSFTHRWPITPGRIPGTHFCQRLSRPQGHSEAEGIRLTGTSSDLIGNRPRNLPARYLVTSTLICNMGIESV
jgi:hypothetical protein